MVVGSADGQVRGRRGRVTCFPTKYYSANTLTVIEYIKLEQLIVRHIEDNQIPGHHTGVNEDTSFFWEMTPY